MDFSSLPFFAAIKGKMQWLSERQALLSENVANADVSGYVPGDLERLDFERLVAKGGGDAGDLGGGTAMLRTDPRHMTATGGSSGGSRAVREPDGLMRAGASGVELEDQMMKVSETSAEYQTAVNLYTKGMGLLRMAIRGQP